MSEKINIIIDNLKKENKELQDKINENKLIIKMLNERLDQLFNGTLPEETDEDGNWLTNRDDEPEEWLTSISYQTQKKKKTKKQKIDQKSKKLKK